MYAEDASKESLSESSTCKVTHYFFSICSSEPSWFVHPFHVHFVPFSSTIAPHLYIEKGKEGNATPNEISDRCRARNIISAGYSRVTYDTSARARRPLVRRLMTIDVARAEAPYYHTEREIKKRIKKTSLSLSLAKGGVTPRGKRERTCPLFTPIRHRL